MMEAAMACTKLAIGVLHPDIALAPKRQPCCPRRTLILKHCSRVGLVDYDAVRCNGVPNHSYSRKFAGARSCLPASPSPSGDTQADETGAVGGEKDGKDESKKKLSSQSSWEAKDVLGNDYLYRLGKEADNMNITVGARGGMIDSLVAGDFPGKEADTVFKYRQKVTRSPKHLTGERYVAPAFMEQADDDATLVERMRGLLQQRRTDEAWQVMQILTRAGKLPDRQCASRLVAQLSLRGVPSSVARAQQILSNLRAQEQVNLLDADSLGLLAMACARSGAGRYSLEVLKLMFAMGLHPSVKVWSAVVSRLSKHVDDCSLALELFDDVCLRLREAEAQEAGLPRSARPDTGAFNAALNACATMGFAAKGTELLRDLENLGLEPDDITFNTLIKLYAKCDQRELMKCVPDLMEEHGVKPDMSTLNSLVAAYVALGDLREAEALLRRLQPNNIAGAEIGSETNSWWGAHLRPDVRTYTTMMKGYVQRGRRSDAMRTLLAMQTGGDPRSTPNEVTYTTAISSCVRLGLMDEASAVLQEMARQNVPANVVTYNVLLKGFCASRQLEKAQGVVADMAEARVALDVVSYNTVINGCIDADDNAAALEWFRRMRDAGIAPSAVSYTTLMKAFGRNGQPKQVHLVFEEMRSDPAMKTDAVVWNVLLDSYCRNGRAADAKRMFLKMKEDRVRPTVYTYATLVKGYATAGMPGEVLVLWREIKARTDDEVNPLQPDEVLLNCLVDTCVRAGYFQKALEVVACMEEKGIPANKTKYKRVFIELYSNLYTGKHASQRRRDKSEERRDAVEAFKFWLGLPNKYYNSGSDDWRSS